jgi:hypothetical protein
MITVGNPRDHNRVMLFLIGYEQRAHLKPWGRTAVTELTPDEPDHVRVRGHGSGPRPGLGPLAAVPSHLVTGVNASAAAAVTWRG